MTEQNFEQMRRAMVAGQLRTTGVNDPRLVAAMDAVPRERFVPADRRASAYADAPLALGGGRALNPPMTTGRLLNEALPAAGEKALVVGAATGYAAAILARLVGSVVALEEDGALAGVARSALADTGVSVVEAPLAGGAADGAPYDLILVDGAVEMLPDALVAQLRDGGRLAAALVDNGVMRLALGRRAGDAFAMVPFADAEATLLPGFSRPRAFTF